MGLIIDKCRSRRKSRPKEFFRTLVTRIEKSAILKICDMTKQKNDSALWLASVTGKLSVFLFLSSLLLFGMYLLGNFQEFLDSTQTMLLTAVRLVSFLSGISSLYYAVSLVISMVYRKKTYFLRIVLSVLGSLASFALAAGASFLLALFASVR